MTDRIKLTNGTWLTVSQLEAAYKSGAATKFTVDTTWFMTDGPGRYISPDMFTGVSALLARTDLAPGVYNLVTRSDQAGYDPNAIYDAAPTSSSRSAVTTGLSNYNTDITSADYELRAWVFGQSAFRLTGGQAVVDATGRVELRNVEIKPLDDNFNFDISGKPAFVQATNSAWRLFNDPLGYGQGVALEFRDQPGTSYPLITAENQESFRHPIRNPVEYSEQQLKGLISRWRTRNGIYDTPPKCFLAGTLIDMADGTQKPIERIRTGDMVMSFDGAANKGRGALVPQRVISTKQNITGTIINLRGLMVTAGHVTLKGEGGFAELRHILRDDGTIVERDGRIMRARSGLPVDSAGDIAVHVEYADPVSGQTRVITARAGIPCGFMEDGKTYKSLGLAIAESGGRVDADGLIDYDGEIRMHAIWPAGWTQTPFEHPLARNFIMRAQDGTDYVPDWCGDLDEAQEGMLEIFSGPSWGQMFVPTSQKSLVEAAPWQRLYC